MRGISGNPFGWWRYGYARPPQRHEDDGQGDELGGGAGYNFTLGVAPSWFTTLINLVPGGSGKVAEFERYLRSEAEAGAKEAIPEITAEVRKTALPYVVGAAALGLAGFLFGLGALRIARSR